MEHHVASFAREAEDEMGSAWEAEFMNQFDGFFCGGEVVATVDSFKSLIVN